ncbi:MAG: 23S rRNA (uracil(1939)-C(5))-methyltransferase RlmD [Thermotogae bacterium]|nr:23S rRNA (uracil(1939)-C(5))-methyltransferase RlmD [Thermotogota bacterium]
MRQYVMRIENLVIDKLVYGGYGLTYSSDGEVIFVKDAYPGELVNVKIVEKRRGYSFAVVSEYLVRSEERVTPQCRYFKHCGGCQWMDLKYESQLKAKKQIVEEQLKRLAKLQIPVEDAVASDKIFRYRNKAEYEIVNNPKQSDIKFGYHSIESEKVIYIDDCNIVPKEFSYLKSMVEKMINSLGIKRRVFTHLVIRKTRKSDHVVILVTKIPMIPLEKDFIKLFKRKLPGVGLMHVENRNSKFALNGKLNILIGEPIMYEEIDWFTYQIPVTSFFQVNISILEKMLHVLKNQLDFNKSERVLDLFCGVGTFGIYFSPLVREVIGIESDRRAVKAARANTGINNIKNSYFLNGDVIDFLKKRVEKKEKFEKVILDPPRSGIGKEGMKLLKKLEPQKIAYISCNPSTLARDLTYLLDDGNYSVESVIPFDMFPHTYHVETICIISNTTEKNKGSRE